MIETNDHLYRLNAHDLPRAGQTLNEAFRDDPVWNRIFDGVPHRENRRRAFFETPVRYCLRYGTVRVTSRRLEGVAAWVPGELAGMSFPRMIRSGAIRPGMRVGTAVMRKLMRSLGTLDTDRKEIMKGRPYLYLAVIGVAPAFQGRGFGGTLLKALFEECGKISRSVYLETETEENVRMYEHFGFKTASRIILPGIDLPMWQMVRE
ncbi:MAG: GNAT family N-acetyltransferase [Spirochaetes bacterium]|nr:GNAT family N-acetyltransferase [Spirochaetota bacterium]